MHRSIELIDTHAGGDISRIVTAGVAPLPGDSVRAQMEFLRDRADGLRRLLLEEPYGRPDMSVDLIVPAGDPQAEAGYIIMEVMGYPIYSGSNTICTATALIESGAIELADGEQHFILDSPAGPVRIAAEIDAGQASSITCAGLPSYLERFAAEIDVPGLGPVTYSIAYSGGFYALVEAAELGFRLEPAERDDLAAAGSAIVEAIRRTPALLHYQLGDVGPLPFVHFMGPVEQVAEGSFRSCSATYVHPGVICRSTTGTGTSARLALMQHKGELGAGDTLETVSLDGASFLGRMTAVETAGERVLVHNDITARGFVLARSSVEVNADDALLDAETILSIPLASS